MTSCGDNVWWAVTRGRAGVTGGGSIASGLGRDGQLGGGGGGGAGVV
jgi:hypothetical protein